MNDQNQRHGARRSAGRPALAEYSLPDGWAVIGDCLWGVGADPNALCCTGIMHRSGLTMTHTNYAPMLVSDAAIIERAYEIVERRVPPSSRVTIRTANGTETTRCCDFAQAIEEVDAVLRSVRYAVDADAP